jgi:hypothetical protein
VNPSEKAEGFARRDLAKIQKAIGRPRVKSHEELRDIPLCVRVSVRSEEGFKPQNEVQNYYPSEKWPQGGEAQPAAPAAAPAATPAPQPAPAPAPTPQPAPAPAPAAPAAPAAATVQPRKAAPWKRQ